MYCGRMYQLSRSSLYQLVADAKQSVQVHDSGSEAVSELVLVLVLAVEDHLATHSSPSFEIDSEM